MKLDRRLIPSSVFLLFIAFLIAMYGVASWNEAAMVQTYSETFYSWLLALMVFSLIGLAYSMVWYVERGLEKGLKE